MNASSSNDHSGDADADAEPSQPFVNVPGHSRPHPSNNPLPSHFPADNASMLTLASSNAAHSMTGATSHRSIFGFGGKAPSLGGGKSIVGSLMGDRRNSSDTSASMRALPPLSRRGSESSTRTGADSIIAPSHAGSHAAPSVMSQAPSAPVIIAPGGPGAPPERINMHRTPSQRTVATQFSIPIPSQSVQAEAA